MSDELMTKSEVAALLRVTPRTIENYLKAGRIPSPTRIGGRPLWSRRAMELRLSGGAAMQAAATTPVVEVAA